MLNRLFTKYFIFKGVHEIASLCCFVVPPRNDVIAKPTQEAEAISMQKVSVNITIESK